jgi:putative ABC transport system substrate-binding protein
VALLTPGVPAFRTSIKEPQSVAQILRLQVYILNAQTGNELEAALKAAKNQHADALVEAQAVSLAPLRPRIIEFAAKNRLPVMYSSRRSVEIGGLMSYGNDPLDQNRRAAVIVDKILKGRNPADIPVERTIKFELAINLRTAKQIGLTIPPNVLARADKVIR